MQGDSYWIWRTEPFAMFHPRGRFWIPPPLEPQLKKGKPVLAMNTAKSNSLKTAVNESTGLVDNLNLHEASGEKVVGILVRIQPGCPQKTLFNLTHW